MGAHRSGGHACVCVCVCGRRGWLTVSVAAARVVSLMEEDNREVRRTLDSAFGDLDTLKAKADVLVRDCATSARRTGQAYSSVPVRVGWRRLGQDGQASVVVADRSQRQQYRGAGARLIPPIHRHRQPRHQVGAQGD
jgi:hypothetical protein